MAQKPIHEMSHRPGKMSEEADYALTELKSAVISIMALLEQRASKEDLRMILSRVEEKADIASFNALVKDYTQKVVEPNDRCSTDELINSISALSTKIDALKDAVILVAERMDSAEASGNEAAVKNVLK